jgi:high-affinity iron transporter
LLLLVLGATSCRKAPQQAQTPARPSSRTWAQATSLKPDLAQGKLIYQSNCLRCHGPQGRGDGPSASFLNPKPTDFTAKFFAKNNSPQHVYEIVLSGPSGKPMPAFGDSLDDQAIVDVAAYVRKFSR